MKKTLTYLFLLLAISTTVLGQYGRNTGRNCILCSVDLAAGWYMPSLDYWNDESYLNEIDGSFDGGLIGALAAEFKLYQGFLGGLQAGYWRDVAEVTNAGPIGNWNEEITLRIIPVTLFGKYEFSLPSRDNRLFPFIGAGVTMNFIQQDLRREVGGVPTELNLSGTTQTINLMAGTKYAIASHLDVGIEYNYVLGTFDQDFIENEVQTTQAVGLDGSLILLKVGITVDDRINPRRGGRYKPGKRRRGGAKNRRFKPKRGRRRSP